MKETATAYLHVWQEILASQEGTPETMYIYQSSVENTAYNHPQTFATVVTPMQPP